MFAPPRWMLFLLCLLSGCSSSPRARLTQIQGQYATLQADTAKLKDESLSLRSRNRELTRRAVEDARRVHDLEIANQQLTRSIAGYQKERDAMADSFEQIKQSVQLASNGSTVAMIDRFENFARAHPGCSYDADRSLWTFPTDQLFAPGGDDWQPNAGLLVDAFARLLQEPDSPYEPTRMTVVQIPSDVQRVSLAPGGSASHLAQNRAVKLSKRLNPRSSGPTPPVAVDVKEATTGRPVIQVQLRRLPVGSGS